MEGRAWTGHCMVLIRSSVHCTGHSRSHFYFRGQFCPTTKRAEETAETIEVIEDVKLAFMPIGEVILTDLLVRLLYYQGGGNIGGPSIIIPGSGGGPSQTLSIIS